MMVPIVPTPTMDDGSVHLPSYLAPMLDVARGVQPLHNVLASIVKTLGFESFVYGMSLSKTHSRDESFYVWATVQTDWLREYDQRSYIEIDPRVSYGWDALPPPLVWDASIGGGNRDSVRFLDRAAEYGIGSGIAVYLRDDKSKIMVALSCPERYLTNRRRAEICAVTGQIMHLASMFHWIFVKQIIAQGIPPAQEGHPLSPREMCCLQFAANGMTSKDIGLKLGITERTANFHFANIISKLGVLNRKEAIGSAMARGLISVNGSMCVLKCTKLNAKVRR